MLASFPSFVLPFPFLRKFMSVPCLSYCDYNKVQNSGQIYFSHLFFVNLLPLLCLKQLSHLLRSPPAPSVLANTAPLSV